eukprot:jgi/Undpi1/3966/HiC_scaffold_16.g07334.m1
MLRQKQPAPPARLRNAERVESKADIDEIEPILVVPRRPPTPGRPPTPPTLEVVEQGPQSVHLGVNAGGRAPARSLVEAPGDDLAGTANYREVVIPGAAAADCFILWNKSLGLATRPRESKSLGRTKSGLKPDILEEEEEEEEEEASAPRQQSCWSSKRAIFLGSKTATNGSRAIAKRRYVWLLDLLQGVTGQAECASRLKDERGRSKYSVWDGSDGEAPFSAQGKLGGGLTGDNNEMDWAPRSGSAATSKRQNYGGFSNVLATSSLGGSRRPALRPHTGSFRVAPVRSCRSAEFSLRPRSGMPDIRLENLGNWPLNTTERWMAPDVDRPDASQTRLDKLREIRESDGSDIVEPAGPAEPAEPATTGNEEEDAEAEEERERQREENKARRKLERRKKKLEAEQKSRWNRERWRTIGRHGDIVARTNASMPALATRGYLVQLKAHANRFLFAKLVRCWSTIASAFGAEHHQAENEIPLPPTDDDKDRFIDVDYFYSVLAGFGVQLTPVESGIVTLRLAEAAAKLEGSGASPGILRH